MTSPERQASKLPAFFMGVVAGCVLAMVGLGWFVLSMGDGARAPVSETIAIRWHSGFNSDGTLKAPPTARYGMHVYIKPTGPSDLGPFDVHAACYIDGPHYFDDIGKIGTAADWADANARFGVIRFTPAGAYVGDGMPAPDGSEDDFLFPTARMTSHR